MEKNKKVKVNIELFNFLDFKPKKRQGNFPIHILFEHLKWKKNHRKEISFNPMEGKLLNQTQNWDVYLFVSIVIAEINELILANLSDFRNICERKVGTEALKCF